MAIQIKPNHAEAYYNMAIAQKEIGALEAALESYKKAIELNPDFIEAKDNLITLLTTFIPKKDASNKLVKLNEDIKSIDINTDISSIISDDQIVNFVSKSEEFITNVDIKHKTKLSQTFRRNSVNLNCSRHMSIFNEHNIIPEFCFGCYKVQVEPKSIIELIKLFIVFDQLELHENNTRKCMVELRPEVSGFYKGLIFCSGLKQANQISDHLNIIIKQSISPQLVSTVKRGCSEYAIAHPDYKEINNSGPQLMNYNKDWKVFEESFDRSNPTETNEITRTSLSGLNLNDALIIQKWIDYAKGMGDSSVDILKQNTVYYQEIYDQAKARLK
jgi:tetratricopeptide (TPR) repeat protein